MSETPKRLIEDYLPVRELNEIAAKEKKHPEHPVALIHYWPARRPITACRAAIYAALVEAPKTSEDRELAAQFVTKLANFKVSPGVIAVAAAQIRAQHGGHSAKVLDIFSGGGAIPLEASRLGCDSHAIEYNPVAHLVELCTLVFPQRFGATLADDVSTWGKRIIDRLRDKVADWYPRVHVEDSKAIAQQLSMFGAAGQSASVGHDSVAYIWVRTVPCRNPQCRSTVPLVRQAWLRKKGGVVSAVPTLKNGTTLAWEIVVGSDAPDSEDEQTGAGGAVCLACPTPVPASYVKECGIAGRIGESLAAFVLPGPRSKLYVAGQQSVERVTPDIEALARSLGLETPNEELKGKLRDQLPSYGFETYKDLFTVRQLGVLITLAGLIRQAHVEMISNGLDADRAAAVATYLGMGFGRLAINVRTAVFDGQFFDATKGKEIPRENFRAQTMWGWIAWSLGGKTGYEMMRQQDEARVAPGADEIMALLAEGPNLILLDEVLQYLISVGGIKIHQTTLRDETMNFLHRLTGAVGNSANTALVFSLQSSKRESLEYVNILQTVDHLAARKDQLREPVEGNEVLFVIQRRLLARIPTAEESAPAAIAYQDIITQMKRGYAKGKAEERQAEEEGIALAARVRAAYPFHPALIDVMREQWAAIPDFQRTRGALRFLAACLRAAKREEKSRAVLGPGDVPIYDAEVRLAFFKEVGQQADFQAVLEHDLTGANARARRIDDRRTRESPSETGKRTAFRLATAILMYSFGGRKRDGVNGAESLPPGITEPELLSVCVGPDLDSTTALACLKELKEQCLYLHFDGVRYCFKKDPNVTLLVEQESEAVGRDERQVEERIKEMLEARITGRNAVVWRAKSGDIPDKEPSFLVAYMPFDFGTQARSGREAAAKEIFETYGNSPRKYRNGLGLAVPAADQIESLRRSVRYLIAIERVRDKSKQHNLTDVQRSQLREQESTRIAEAESSLLKLYAEVWLPKVTTDGIVIDVAAAGGRPLQTTLNDKKQARVHDRMMELLVDVQRRVFETATPSKIVELFKLGEGTPPALGIKTADVVDGFYSFLGFPRLVSSGVVKKAIAKGIQDRFFAYYSGSTPVLGSDGKYQVPLARVRSNAAVSEDEIDLESGFLIMPQALPVATRASGSAGVGPNVPADSPAGEPALVLTPTSGPSDVPGTSTSGAPKSVEINFSADRNQLFSAWNAIANLADLAGKVNVTVRADSAEGFDKGKLQNGVLEPLRESDLIK